MITHGSDARTGAAELLTACGVESVPHVQGNLRTHLEGTFELLREWGNAPHVCMAGFLHTAYGTDGFPHMLVSLEDRRTIADIAGVQAEHLIYFYGSCDRAFLYPAMAAWKGGRRGAMERLRDVFLTAVGRRPAPVSYRDRYRGEIFTPRLPLFRDFLELTVANELEILRRQPDVPEARRQYWRTIFAPWHGFLTAPAVAAIERVLA